MFRQYEWNEYLRICIKINVRVSETDSSFQLFFKINKCRNFIYGNICWKDSHVFRENIRSVTNKSSDDFIRKYDYRT
jgi:hypothetical protein